MLYKRPKNGKIKAVLVLSSPSSIIEYYLVFKNKFVTFIRALKKIPLSASSLCTNFRNLCTNFGLIVCLLKNEKSHKLVIKEEEKICSN